jgi:hypothetical protein
MRIGDVLYFSPDIRFSELDFNDVPALIRAFQDRVEGFYLKPAARSLVAGDGFAGGLVSCAAIELIAKISAQQRPAVWLRDNLAEFGGDGKLAQRFWALFRDGLAHEGRIKRNNECSGQFSLEIPDTLTMVGPVLVVNPQKLLEGVHAAFRRNCEAMTTNQTGAIARHLRRYFELEARACMTE